MNSKYIKSSCKKCNWKIVLKQSPDSFCLTPPGQLMKHFCNKIPKTCPKCGSELKTKEASFFDYASPDQWGKRIFNGKRQLLELLKNRPK